MRAFAAVSPSPPTLASWVRTTLTIDDQVLRAVKVRAARTGKGDSEVIEEALRRELVSRWLTGDFELVVSEELLSELGRALAYPKLRTRVPADDAEQLVARFRLLGSMAPDPPKPLRWSSDAGDDYLFALAESTRALVISGDQHVLRLADELPVRSARQLLEAFGPEEKPYRRV